VASDLFMERYEAARARRLESEHGVKTAVFTVGDLMDAIWSVDNEEDARLFYAGHVANIQRQIDAGVWESQYSAEEGARADIGWMYGEGMTADRIAMWRRATGAEHPGLPIP
jgi:hypothetical protein